jgi:hypothetical protein
MRWMLNPFRSQLLHRLLDPVIGAEAAFINLPVIAESLAHRHGGAECLAELGLTLLRRHLFKGETEFFHRSLTEGNRIIAGLDAK